MNHFMPVLSSGKFWVPEINPRLLLVDYTPTCENMLLEMVKHIAGALPEDVDLHSARLRETATSFAEWFGSDNQ